ncbi:predicted protein, partial [Arabidopsis lyrata subsp. lyrata]
MERVNTTTSRQLSSLNFGMHNWIRDITHWQSKFESVRFLWTGRAQNKAADQLSKSPLPPNTDFVFHFITPRQIKEENNLG